MGSDQAKRIVKILRNLRDQEKERIDRYFSAAEDVVASLINDEIANRSSIAVSDDSAGRDRLLNKSELADRLRVSTRTVDELLSEGMPRVQLRKRVLFDYDDVVAWAKTQSDRAVRKPKLRVVR